MKISGEKLRLGLLIALALAVLPVAKFGTPEQGFAQGKLVVAMQAAVSSDEMLKKAQPLEKFLRAGWSGKTDVQIYVHSSFTAAAQG